GAAVLHGMAAGGVTLVGGKPRIGGDHFQGVKGNVQFFGGDLLKRGLKTLTEFGLAGEGRDAAVGVDANPGVEVWRGCETARGFRSRRRRGLIALTLRESI